MSNENKIQQRHHIHQQSWAVTLHCTKQITTPRDNFSWF